MDKDIACKMYLHGQASEVQCNYLDTLKAQNAELTTARDTAIREVGKISTELGKKDAECDRLREALDSIYNKVTVDAGSQSPVDCLDTIKVIARKAINDKGGE